MNNKINWQQIFEVVCRWYVFLFLNFYGIGKIMGGQFYRRGEWPLEVANTTIAEASAYDLAWSFMGYSFLYILFIGISQIIGAWLLLWNKTKLLGVIILFPIMVNIIVFDIIFLDVKDALVNASIYFFMLLYILYFNRKEVGQAFRLLLNTSSSTLLSKPHYLRNLGFIFFLMAIIFGIDQFFVNLLRP